jgi:hypothetical protein
VKDRPLALSLHVTAAVALTAVVCVTATEQLKPFAATIYLIQLTSILAICYFFRGGTSALIRPSIVGLAYLNISFIFGAAAFHFGQITQLEMLDAYRGWHDFKEIMLFFVLANFLAALPAIAESKNQFNEARKNSIERPQSNLTLLLILSITLLASTAIDHELVAVVRITICIAIFCVVFQQRYQTRWIIVIATILLIATVSSDSKRNAIFLALPALWLELSTGSINRLSLKVVMLTMIGASFLIVLIMAMSIMRGYGLLDPANFFDAITLVPKYIQDPKAWSFLANNFEFSTVFFSSHNAIHLINQNSILLAMGETLLKPFFTGIPESVFGYKPRTILDLYTSTWSPTFRGIGGSYPITFLSEFYWNFHWLGLIPLTAFMLLIEKLYNQLKSCNAHKTTYKFIFWMCVYFFMLFLMRGSGLDIVFAYMLISTLVIATVIAPAKLINDLANQVLRNVRKPT